MSGILGNWELLGGIPQAVYQCDNDDFSVVNVNVCNRSNRTASISIAISSSETSPGNAEWVEFETVLLAKGTLERTGITINPGQYLVVKSSISNVNSVVWGITTGEPSGLPAITQNLGTAPTWLTTSGTYETLPSGSLTFSAFEASSYSLVSGSLPAGAVLIGETGTLQSFTAPATATNYTFTLRATSSAGLTTDREFTARVLPTGGTVTPPSLPVVTTFSYTGLDQSYTVPPGKTTIAVYLWGAGGTGGGCDSAGDSSQGGGAGSVQHTAFPVTPGEVLTIRVGQGPSYQQGGNGTTTTNWNTNAFGGGGIGGAGDGAGANGSFGGHGGGASSILRAGDFRAIAAGGGGGGGPGYNDSGSALTGEPGGTGNGAGGNQRGNGIAGGSGSNGGGGGGGGGSGSSLAAGNGLPGLGGANFITAGGTEFSGSGTTPGNTTSPYYQSGIGVGGGLVGASGTVASGHGLVVIVH